MEHGHRDQHRLLVRQRQRVGLERADRVQEVGAVRVDDAFGRARGARGVAEPGWRGLVERAPGHRLAMLAEQRLELPGVDVAGAGQLGRGALLIQQDDVT